VNGTGWRTAGALIRACHPEPAAAVTAGACVLAIAVGRDALGVIEVGAAVAATQLAVGWSNDWLDADRDVRVGRTDKPVASGEVSRRSVGLAAIAAAVAAVPLAMLSGWRAGAVLVVAMIAGLLYNWPLKFTVWSVVPYVVAFGALAAFVPMSRPGSPLPPWWLVAAGALLGAGAHFVNVLPDLDDDARTGVNGLPHRLGDHASVVISAALLLAATGLLAFAPAQHSAWPAWLAFGLAVAVLLFGFAAGRRPGSRAAFRAVLLVALIDVALLIASGASGLR
jgi:heme o synthase